MVSRVKILVAHNVRFHRTLVRSELSAVGLPTEPLEALPTLCTMERGRVLGFKRRDTGEALYPKLSELFGYLYLHEPEVSIISPVTVSVISQTKVTAKIAPTKTEPTTIARKIYTPTLPKRERTFISPKI